MFNKKPEFDKERFDRLETRKIIFINKFVGYFFSILEHRESIGIKKEAPQPTGIYLRSAQGLSIAGTVAAPVGDGLAAGFGVPVPAGSVVKLGTDVTGGLITYFGKRAANKKTKKFIRFIEQNERYELETLLTEAAKDIAIAFEYHLSHFKGNLDIERLASTAADLLAIYFNKPENQQISLTRATIIQGIIEGAYANKVRKFVKLVKGEERAKNMELENDLYASWHSMDLLSKAGLLTRESECKVKVEGCDIERYSFRREFFPDLDQNFTDATNISADQLKHYNNYVNTWYVTTADLIDFAQAVKNGDIEQTKSFNSYISDIYVSGRPVIAACKNRTIPAGCKLENLNFSESYFIDVDFSGVSLKGTNLTKAHMPKVKFMGVDLTGVYFNNAYLVRANFEKANINGAKFPGADLTCAKLRNIKALNDQTDFTNIKRAGIDYSGTELDQAIMDISLYDIIKGNKKLEQKIEKIEQRYNELYQQKEKHATYTTEEIERLNSKVRKLKKHLQKERDKNGSYSSENIHVGPKIVGKLNGGSNFARLKQALKQESIVVVSSTIGSDATQLARYYAHYYLEQGSSSIVFEMNADTLASLKTSYRQFAASLEVVKDVEELKYKNIEEVQKLVREELSKKYRKGYLLIISNIDNTEVKSEIKNYIPQENGHVIVTTQDSTLPLFLNAASLSLREWSKKEACLYIIKKLNNRNIKIDLNEIELLAEKLKFIPLGIDIATLYIKTKNISIADYIERLNTSLSNGVTGQDPLKAAIILSMDDLDTYEKNILKFCSFLGANSIPIWLLKVKIQNMYPQFNEKKCELILDNCIKILSRYSLIAGIEGKNSSRFLYLHQSVQEVSKLYLTQQEEQKKFYINQLSKTLIKFASRNNNSNEKFKTNQTLISHIENLILNVDIHKIAFTPNLIYLQVCSAVFYDFIGEHKKAIEVLTSQKEQIEKIVQINKVLEHAISYFELSDTSKYLLTIYGQVLYHLGRAHFNESLENDISEKCFKQAVRMREIIDAAIKTNEIYKEVDKQYNEGEPRPMDSTIFKRNGLYLWYNLKGYKDKDEKLLNEALEGYNHLINIEPQLENLKDKFNLGICRIGVADTLFKLAKLKFPNKEEYTELCNQALSFIFTHLREGLGIKIEKNDETNLEVLFNKMENYSRATNATRAAREYELLGKILSVRVQDNEDTIYAEKFLKRAKEIDSGKSYITGNALFGLAYLYSNKPDGLDIARKYLAECIDTRSRIDPKMLFEAEVLKNEISPTQNLLVLDQKGKEKDEVSIISRNLKNTKESKIFEILQKKIIYKLNKAVDFNSEAEKLVIPIKNSYRQEDLKSCLNLLNLEEIIDYTVSETINDKYAITFENKGLKKLELMLKNAKGQIISPI
ncbi:pentapeptide repeat-containing protein [Holosporaceae bacterium 'Namur']|nr:pentapeptide repeat-containing protein [Holosporaceae bacterium 'Namur']